MPLICGYFWPTFYGETFRLVSPEDEDGDKVDSILGHKFCCCGYDNYDG